MWLCPYCRGDTKPITINEVSSNVKEKILRELDKRENPVIVKCERCGRIWVDEL